MGALAIPLIIGAVGTVLGGVQQASYQKQQAKVAKQELAARTEDRQRRAVAFEGTQEAEYGAAGVELAGTPGDVVVNTAREFGREQGDDNFNTKLKIYQYKQNAQNTMTNSLFDVATSVVGKGLRTTQGG